MFKSDEPLPRPRGLEARPFVSDDGVEMFALIDPTGFAPAPVALTRVGCLTLTMLDGRRTAEQICAAVARQMGVQVRVDVVLALVDAVDRALMLDTPRFSAAYAEKRRLFRDADVRDNRDRWPDERSLRKEIEQTLALSGQPAAKSAIQGIVAPHLDYARGKPCYATAYAALCEATTTFDRVVILGTNHYGTACGTVATGKDFLTPLGRMGTDRGFLSKLSTALDFDLCMHEFDHAREHSIELHVHLLQHAFAGRTISIVPLLCPDPSGPSGIFPADEEGPSLDDVADAIVALLAADDTPTLLIASADLSHVGQQFGEEDATDEVFLERVATSDRAALDLLVANRAEEFVRNIAKTANATRICSVGCLYVIRQVLRDCTFELLNYHQATDFQAETHVSCAAAILQK